jgi:hypothetical protein
MDERKHFLRFRNGAVIGYAFAVEPHPTADADEDWRECLAEDVENAKLGANFQPKEGGGVELIPWPIEQRIARARASRNALLASTDHYDNASAPQRLGAQRYAAWLEYRQALRDITQLPGFPDNFRWPKPPGQEVEEEA